MKGMWPSEGSVSEEVIPLVADAGIQWLATDEGVLRESYRWSGLEFDKVIAMGKGSYFDDARYGKSEALVKQNKKAEAKILLDEIIKEGGPFKSRSMDLEKK